MKIDYKTYWGPNLFSKKKCIVFSFLNISNVEKQQLLNNLNHTIEYLTSFFQYKYPKKTTINLDDVLFFIAHSSLFILNYVRGDLDEYDYIKTENEKTVFIEFHEPKLTIFALNFIVDLLLNCNNNKYSHYDEILNSFWDQCQKYHPDWQAHPLISAAKSRNINYASLGRRLWVYGMGKYSKIFFETSPLEDLNSNFQTDKLSGKIFFKNIEVPTADYHIIENKNELIEATNKVGFPCAIKPVYGGAGKGVTANVKSLQEAEFAYDNAVKNLKKSKKVMIEKFVMGKDYRLIAVNGKVIACVQRSAPIIIGDGINTIESLIYKQINQYRTRNIYESNYKRPVPIDNSVVETLKLYNLTLESIPSSNQLVTLRRNDNLSTGGTAKIIKNIHPKVIKDAEKIINQSGFYSLGIDYITSDITKSPNESNGKFIEINTTQGIDALLATGYDTTLAGNVFLGNDIKNTEVNLFILKETNLQKFLKTYSGDYALVLPNIIIKSNTIKKVEKIHFSKILNNILTDKNLVSLDIIAEIKFVENNGFPTEHLNTIYIDNSSESNFITQTITKLKSNIKYIAVS